MNTRPIYHIILIALLILSFGCDKEDEVTCIEDCTETYLEQNQMVSYKGGEIGCKYFLKLYEYKNKQYYVLGNHCADMSLVPTDCSGNTLCGTGNSKDCNEFFEYAKYIGIVGIEA